MKKPFCDVCGAPAFEGLERWKMRACLRVGTPHRAPEPGSTSYREVQCQAVATTSYTFENHPTGFGGPPDLCVNHARDLLQGLLDALPRRTDP